MMQDPHRTPYTSMPKDYSAPTFPSEYQRVHLDSLAEPQLLVWLPFSIYHPVETTHHWASNIRVLDFLSSAIPTAPSSSSDCTQMPYLSWQIWARDRA